MGPTKLMSRTNPTCNRFSCLMAGDEIEKRTTASIGSARQKIGKEISELNEKLKVCKGAIQQMKAEIAKLEQPDQEPQDSTVMATVVQ